MADQLSERAIYAALCEQVYRRDDKIDQAIKLADIPGISEPLNVDVSKLPASLNLTQKDGYIYSTGGDTAGFVALVTKVNGKFVITLRGTDSTVSAWTSAMAAALVSLLPAPIGAISKIPFRGKIDYGDAYTNK